MLCFLLCLYLDMTLDMDFFINVLFIFHKILSLLEVFCNHVRDKSHEILGIKGRDKVEEKNKSDFDYRVFNPTKRLRLPMRYG